MSTETGPIFTPQDGAAIWVEAERKRQDRKWGGWDHDSQHTDREWVRILNDRLIKLGRAEKAGIADPIRRRAIELTSVGMAYLEHLHSKSMDNLADAL